MLDGVRYFAVLVISRKCWTVSNILRSTMRLDKGHTSNVDERMDAPVFSHWRRSLSEKDG